MTCSRQDARRSIDFESVRDPHSIQNAIQALLCRRLNPMSEKQICQWFRGTSAAFIGIELTLMVGRGLITKIEGFRGGVTYTVSSAAARDE